MSDSLRPYGLQSAKLLCPWDSLGKNTGVGFHFLLQNEHEFEQTLGESEEQGSLTCCSPWGCKVSDTSQQLNNSNKNLENISPKYLHEKILEKKRLTNQKIILQKGRLREKRVVICTLNHPSVCVSLYRSIALYLNTRTFRSE